MFISKALFISNQIRITERLPISSMNVVKVTKGLTALTPNTDCRDMLNTNDLCSHHCHFVKTMRKTSPTSGIKRRCLTF
jgi:hypothetical protein